MGQRPPVVLDRPIGEALPTPHREPLGRELVERWVCGRRRRNRLRPRRLPDPSTNVGEHVRELLLRCRLGPSLFGRAERFVSPLAVGAEAEREASPLLPVADDDLACCWSAHCLPPFLRLPCCVVAGRFAAAASS